MPCMCWYTPDNESKRKMKDLCVQLVEHIKQLSREGDPLGCTLQDAHKLIDHLYNKGSCKEDPLNK